MNRRSALTLVQLKYTVGGSSEQQAQSEEEKHAEQTGCCPDMQGKTERTEKEVFVSGPGGPEILEFYWNPKLIPPERR